MPLTIRLDCDTGSKIEAEQFEELKRKLDEKEGEAQKSYHGRICRLDSREHNINTEHFLLKHNISLKQ
jgi:hypothetical protein